MTEELKPCPFCGSDAKISYVCGDYAVMCTNEECKACTDWVSETEAIRRWNRRVSQ